MAAFYRSGVADFLRDDADRIVGQLAAGWGDTGFNELQQQQLKAWKIEISVLFDSLRTLTAELPDATRWTLLLEYSIPRRQRRIDAILLAADLIFCVEFKTKDKAHSRAAERQVEDYALDLRDFHEESRGRRIIPVVVVPKAPAMVPKPTTGENDLVCGVRLANAGDFADLVRQSFGREHDPAMSVIDAARWEYSAYRPVPTIIEAAEALYAGHDVREIAHFHADNLNLTADKIIEVIRRAQQDRHKVICFVTGVPGAGKTLAGLNVVHNPALRQQGRPPGVFLSGNGPLVKIISAAITRDFKRRTRQQDGERKLRALVQNVHTFVREALEKPDAPPAENVIVFDEAQRAWDSEQTARKTGREDSEPAMLLSIMDRQEWAVVVALVGAGQEINVGEAGLAEWGRSLQQRFSHWRVVVSPKALDGDASLAGQRLFDNLIASVPVLQQEPALHLEVCLRSYRAKQVTEWVNAVLSGDSTRAAAIARDINGFPIRLTRSLLTAKEWLRGQARGLRRCGLVASSGAVRLRPEGLELSSGFRQGNRDMYVHWFLAPPGDIRASNQLEIAASEFECQGLELDWVGVCWGGDFTFNPSAGGWQHRNFSGNRWGEVHNAVDRQYLLNTYRVLLTRAREGLVVWVPKGDSSDPTRPLDWFDATFDYLVSCGMTEI